MWGWKGFPNQNDSTKTKTIQNSTKTIKSSTIRKNRQSVCDSVFLQCQGVKTTWLAQSRNHMVQWAPWALHPPVLRSTWSGHMVRSHGLQNSQLTQHDILSLTLVWKKL